MELKTNPEAAALPLAPPPSFAELTRSAFHIGCVSFGGAAGQIAMLHRMMVEEKRWVSERDFLDGLNFCTLLPGPEAQQLATYIGWRLHGVAGALAMGGLFVLPGAVLILILAQAYALGAAIPAVMGLLMGIKAAVVAIIADALLRLSRRALASPALKGVALFAFAAMAFSRIPFPLVIVAAAAFGMIMARKAQAPSSGPIEAVTPALGTSLLTLAIWWLPVGAAALALGADHLLVEVGLFFSKLAVITFGGAYALLAYLSEEAVQRGWAEAGQMLDALGLAETTPGPTILVNPFIAFLAGWKSGGGALAWLAGLMAIWTTFAPSFLWIFAGGPYLSRITADPRLAGALRGISAAVVGIIGSVALKFAVIFLFTAPVRVEAGLFLATLPSGGLDLKAALLTAMAAALLFYFRWPLLRMLGLMAFFGALTGFLH